MTDLCAKCGHPRAEHSYNGACYGLCGEFVETPRSAVRSEDAISEPQARYEAQEPWPAAPLCCQCEACQRDQFPHASDCAVHNGPAMPVGSCTCRGIAQASSQWQPIATEPNDGNYRLYRLTVNHRDGTSWGEVHYLAWEDGGDMIDASGDKFSDWSHSDFEYWAEAPSMPSAHRGIPK